VRRPRPLSDPHHLRRIAQSVLHFLQYGFMLLSPNSPLLAWCALRFQHASLAIRTPVTVQRQTFFNIGIAPDQRLSSRHRDKSGFLRFLK
jgi:hypothetical protein